MLRSTGVAGHPGEFSDRGFPRREWESHLESDPHGVKLGIVTMRHLWPHVGSEDRAAAKYIWLTRNCTWRQAISQYRAKVSGVWHIRSGWGVPGEHKSVPFDAAAITGVRDEIAKQNRQWGRWFARRQIEPLLVTYEDLCREPAPGVRRILAELGISYDGAVDTGGLSVMRDDQTEHWLSRLR